MLLLVTDTSNKDTKNIWIRIFPDIQCNLISFMLLFNMSSISVFQQFLLFYSL